MARSFGVEMELISPKEAAERFLLMSLDGVVGAAFTPATGSSTRPVSRTRWRSARRAAGRIFTNTNVEKINLKNGRAHEVVTDQGTIQTEIVVNASGLWGRVGKLVGLSLPVVPMAHLYLMTLPIEGGPQHADPARPDLLVYWRGVGGFVMGGYERQPVPFGLNGIPRDFKSNCCPKIGSASPR